MCLFQVACHLISPLEDANYTVNPVVPDKRHWKVRVLQWIFIMPKKRMVDTKYWDDEYITTLDPIEKLLFLYFLTCTLSSICGVYEINLRRVAFDTGIDKDMVAKVLGRFTKDRKILYLDNWIVMVNSWKYIGESPKVKKGFQVCISEVPKEIKAKFSTEFGYSIDTVCIEYGYSSNSSPSPSNKTTTVTGVTDGPSIIIGSEKTMTEELSYERYDTPAKKSTLGKKTMAYLAYKYLELQDIRLAPGESYDANKIAKGLSKLYNETGKDVEKTVGRMTIAKTYFEDRKLDWTPEAVWRNWEKIKKWYEDTV